MKLHPNYEKALEERYSRYSLNEFVKEDDINIIIDGNNKNLDSYNIDLSNLEDLKRPPISSYPNSSS